VANCRSVVLMSKYRFVKDDDGHNYLIPDDLTETFYYELCKDMYEDYRFDIMFDEYRCDSISKYTFENPLED
jgi:hypothetical protein